MYATEKQKKGWIEMIKTLITVYLPICCLIFAVYLFAYVFLLIVGDLVLLIIKIKQFIKERRNKHGKIS